MTEEKKKVDKPKKKDSEKPKEVFVPKVVAKKPALLSVEEWAKQEPVKGITADMVLAQGGWGQGKPITKSQWLATAKAIFDTPIGFKN